MNLKTKVGTKILALLLLITLLLTILPINAIIAASKMTISLSSVSGNRGSEVIVNVNLSNNPGVRVLGGKVSFDRTKLEYVSSEVKSIENSKYTDSSYNESTGNITFYLAANDSTSEPMTANGTIATIKFKIKDTASGTANMNISMDDVTINKGEYLTDYVEQGGTVTVKVPATGISLNKQSLTLEKGKSEKLVATVAPSDATDKTVNWSSSNSSIATVDSQGNVTAKAKGTAVIFARAGNYTATCNITVTQPVEGITLNKTTLDLEKGKSETLIATVIPSNADGDKTITWSTNNPSVATVDNGKVTGVGKGNAVITAKVGDKTATCKVTVGVPLKSISLNKTNLSLNKGNSETLTITYNPEDTDADKTATWTSSNTGVATVVNGKITAVDAGETTITAKVGACTATCKVIVNIPLKSISIKSSTQIQYGQTEKLTVTYNPVDTTDDKTVIWTSNDEKVAQVTTDGTVKALKVGEATITARVGDKTANCVVTVLPVPLNSISIKEQNIEINKGGTKDLTVIYNPENTTENKTVTWKTSDEKVVKVENGKITAIGAGTATITATVGDKTATTQVKVNVPLQSITLNKTELTINKGKTANLDIIYNPIDTTVEKTEEWVSSDTSVVTVNEYGLITAVGRGTAYVKAKVAGKETTCKVTVNVPLTGINLKEKTELLKGQTEKLVVEYLPADTTDSKNVTWSTNNPEIVEVDENGVITAKKEGTAIITAKVGNFEKNCEVTVKEIKLDSIEINMTDFELGLGRTQILKVLYNPENTTDDTKVIWKSSNENVAIVDENGLVTAKGLGTATITATVGNKTAQVEITVTEIPVEEIILNVENSKVNIGDKINLKISTNPSDATNVDNLKITSSNNEVIYIDEQGNIIAKTAGKAIITVEAENGVKSQIEIEVLEPEIGDNEDEQKPEEGEDITQDNENKVENSNNEKTENAEKEVQKTNSPHTGDIAVEGLAVMLVISLAGIIIIVKRTH